MKIFYKIKLFKIVGRNKIKSTSLWHVCCLSIGLKILGSSPYRGGVYEFL
jgi:hypothetical protein